MFSRIDRAISEWPGKDIEFSSRLHEIARLVDSENLLVNVFGIIAVGPVACMNIRVLKTWMETDSKSRVNRTLARLGFSPFRRDMGNLTQQIMRLFIPGFGLMPGLDTHWWVRSFRTGSEDQFGGDLIQLQQLLPALFWKDRNQFLEIPPNLLNSGPAEVQFEPKIRPRHVFLYNSLGNGGYQ